MSYSGFSQERIEGTYVQDVGMFSYEGNILDLYKDGSFVFYKWSDFGEFIGFGKYRIEQDSLYIDFDDSSKAQNRFEVLKTPIIDSLASTDSSSIRLLSCLDPHEKYSFYIQLIKGDSIVGQEVENGSGIVFFDPKKADKIKLGYYGYKTEIFGNMGAVEYEIEEKEAMAYYFLLPQKEFLLNNYKEKYKVRIKRHKLILINTPNTFFHPGNDRQEVYLLRKYIS